MILLDASALYPLAKLAGSKVAEVAARLLEEDAAILDLTLYESLNAAVIEARRGLVENPARLAAAIAGLARHLKMIRVSVEDAGGIGELAEQLGLTVYDAAHVYYAKAYGARLVTSDKELLRKAGEYAVSATAWLSSAGY